MGASMRSHYPRCSGFTIIEVMIAVAIIGLLAVIAIPNIMKARNSAQVRSLANDLRVFEDAVQLYAMYNPTFPPSSTAWGSMPASLGGYLKGDRFEQPTVLGGQYAWINIPFFLNGPCLVAGSLTTTSTMLFEVDKVVDDGVGSTGRFRYGGNIFFYYVEQ